MAEESLKVVIGADVNGAINGINKFNTALAKVKPASNQATFALTNLSRVAQDAPFGFIGIANNLNPLLESFQRLRLEAGSNKAALQALGASLIGPGGLGFAIGLLSAGLSFFALANNRSGKAAKDSAKEIKEAFEVVSDSTASVQGDIAKVNALAAAVTNSNLTYKERKNALEQLKETNKNYFGDLTLEASKLATLSSRITEYTQALIQNAVVKGFESEISKISQEIFNQQREVKKAALAIDFYTAALKKAKQESSQTGPKGIAAVSTDVTTLDNLLNKATGDFNKQVGSLGELKTKYSELGEGINDAVNATLKLKPLTTDLPKKIKEAKEAFKDFAPTVVQSFKQIQEELGGRADIGESIGLSVDTSKVLLPIITLADGIEEQSKRISAAKIFENLRLQAIATAQTITDFVSPVFDSLFTSLLSGSKKPFQALGDALKQLVAQLAAAITKALILKFVTAAIGGAGGAGLGKGIQAAISALGSIGGIANNGINAGSITGSAFRGMNVNGQLTARGTDLVFVFDKTNTSISKNF